MKLLQIEEAVSGLVFKCITVATVSLHSYRNCIFVKQGLILVVINLSLNNCLTNTSFPYPIYCLLLPLISLW